MNLQNFLRWGLILGTGLGLSFGATAAPSRYQMQFEFQRHGQSVCKSSIVADPGTWYVVCGLNARQNPLTQIRLHVTPIKESPKQNHVRSIYEEIDPATGEVLTVSNAMVAVLDGETSSVSQESYDEQGRPVPVLSFEVKVDPVP